MKLMFKDGKYEYVADAHFDSFIKQGYAVADGVPPTPEGEMAALKEENARLKAELEAYQEQVFRMLTPCEGSGEQKDPEVPADEVPETEPEAPVKEAPKKSKKAKSE